MDLTIAYMVLVHETVALSPDALVLTHILIVVFIPNVGMVFPLEVLSHHKISISEYELLFLNKFDFLKDFISFI
jgi:hypothetical protein